MKHDIIVVAASAGGVEALIKLVEALPGDLDAAVFVVLHIPAESPSLLPVILSRSGPLQAVHPVDGVLFERKHIYIAPPDHHMLLERDHIRVVRGPRENRHRPAADPLFRSAALEYSTRVIGVVLTGALDDGTAGLLAVKQRGGVAVVQDPKDAVYPSMPQNALRYVKVDHCLPLAQIPALLARLVVEQAAPDKEFPVTPDMEREVKIAKMDVDVLNSDEHAGTPSAFSCPDCGGVLWELHDGELARFRCRVGHSFSSETMQAAQLEVFEDAVWTAYKTLQESSSFSRRMAQQAKERGNIRLAHTFEEKADETEKRANVLRAILIKDSLEGVAVDHTLAN